MENRVAVLAVIVREADSVAALDALLRVAVPEALCSLLFVVPVYALFLWVFRRVPKKTVL